MRSNRLTLILLGALALAPASTSAATPADSPRFRIEVKGVQTTSWSSSKDDNSAACDPGGYGAGTETIRFSSKPAVITALPTSDELLLFGQLRGRARVARKGKVVTNPTPLKCEGEFDVGSGPSGYRPDCGARKLAISLQLSYLSKGFTLFGQEGPDGFKTCPVGGTSFPNLLTQDTLGREVKALVPAADLLDRRTGKHIVVARGVRRETTELPGYVSESTTRIRWEVSLTRLK